MSTPTGAPNGGTSWEVLASLLAHCGQSGEEEWNQSLPSALLWCVFLKCLLLWATAVLSIA